MPYKVNQKVRSKPVGGAPAFSGKVKVVHPDGVYEVHDYLKGRWIRNEDQLEPEK